jgi:phage gpG-like protein
VKIRITSKNSLSVIRGLQELPEKVLQAAAKGLANGLLQVVGISQNEYLAGPRRQKLGEVSGNLRRSIQSLVEVIPDRGVIGRIGTVIPYGAFHEFGFTGDVQVKAHTRVVNLLTTTGHAFEPRREILNAAGERVGWRTNRVTAIRRALGKGLGKGLKVQLAKVKAHVRRINYPGRPFVKPALEQGEDAIRDAIAAELETV